MITVCLLAIFSGVAGCSTCSPPAGACPAGWLKWRCSCYLLRDTFASYDDSHKACQERGAELAAPHSLRENEFFASLASRTQPQQMWIGCNDREAAYDWVCEGQERGKVFTRWDSGSPDHVHDSPTSTDHCTMMLAFRGTVNFGRWFDGRCMSKSKSLCVKRMKVLSHRLFSFVVSNPSPRCLLDRVIDQSVTKSYASCASACIATPGCLSFNIRVTEQGGRKLCPLNGGYQPDDPALNIQPLGPTCVLYEPYIE
ncbi:C-type lectin-like [Acanthaster planci]|uniref:C-type lectin-like n=1 Tax=Acanthaster planci TaxID=133434 RepID=A0A8B7Y1Z9_ACAPL|nr:C-type lectin-like [Acanthaster planci]